MRVFQGCTALALAVLATTGFAACAGIRAQVRHYTYPPDFNYIEARQLDSAMWRMADQVRRLDASLRDTSLEEPQRRSTVIDSLDRMHEAGRELGTDHRATNHPLLDKHLAQVLDDIALARAAASDSPPRYALAGAVAGACVYCHLPRLKPVGPSSS